MNDSPLLLRQIHPSFIQNGHAHYTAFRPTKKDHKRLSVSDGNKISAEEAWKRYTETLGYNSCGVLGVTISECESKSLSVQEDPRDDQPDHMVIDFSHFDSHGKIDKAAKALCQFASNRGWLYFPNQ